MRKIETIWHHLLLEALEQNQYKHTQQEIANEFGYSLSTVNHALSVPTQLGAIRKTAKFFVLEDFEKLLYYWASVRRLEKDIFFTAHLNAPLMEIEGLVPASGIYAGYSAARRILTEPPADYAKVYFYAPAEDYTRLKERFPPPPNKREQPNVFALKMAPQMSRYGQVTTLPQTFVDIWNMHDWYARGFVRALEEKMNKMRF